MTIITAIIFTALGWCIGFAMRSQLLWSDGYNACRKDSAEMLAAMRRDLEASGRLIDEARTALDDPSALRTRGAL